MRVGGRALIVGITDQTVTMLGEAPELIDRYESQQQLVDEREMQAEAERTVPPAEQALQVWSDAAPAPKPTRMNFFEALRESTVRRS